MALPCLNEAPDSNNPRRSGSEAEEFETEVSRALIVFARLPVLGKVKTRLAAGVGTEAACEFYKACAEHVIQEAGRCPGVQAYLFYSDAADEARIGAWLEGIGERETFLLAPQVTASDVGTKMIAAFGQVFQEGAHQAVVIGSDIPDLTRPLIMDAFTALNTSDCVFGPAKDGGYYLMGCTRPQPRLFQNIPWSTPEVYALSLEAAEEAELRLAPPDTLPPLFDIDTVQDLEEWHHLANNVLKRTLSRARILIRQFSRETGRRQLGHPGVTGAGMEMKNVGSRREDAVCGRSDEGGEGAARCSFDSGRGSSDGATPGDTAASEADGKAIGGCGREAYGMPGVAVNGVGNVNSERNERMCLEPSEDGNGAQTIRVRKGPMCTNQSRSSLALLADRILHERQLLLEAMAETGYTL